MANITKVQYINDLNAYLRTITNNKKNADATDVSRSTNEITITDFPTINTTELSSTTVSGLELQSVLENFTKEFSRVRSVNFYKNINGTDTYQYSRFARINSTLSDSTRTIPINSTYNDIQPLEDINLTNYHNILNSLSGTLNTNYNKFYKNYFFCHSSCHNNCHSSRGRR